MTSAVFLALALVAGALAPRPVQAVTFAECQAFLCLPGGFPAPECDAAEVAVRQRLDALLPALPSWSSCAAAFGWDAANLMHNEHQHWDCPNGGNLSGGQCRGTDQNGDGFCYTPRQRVTVQVVVDGTTSFQPNHTLTHTQRAAGTPVIVQNPLTCSSPPPPPPIIPRIPDT